LLAQNAAKTCLNEFFVLSNEEFLFLISFLSDQNKRQKAHNFREGNSGRT